jgi:N-acetylglucosaminyldiphosphoundecaprenol N-acetyl-beta-D-mannosaminyltransferase
VGAPKSEVFVHRYSGILCPCWALCVGQSFRLLIGTTTPPPAIFVALNLEWLWRLTLEPGRMLRRYVPSAIGFIRSALEDIFGHHGEATEPANPAGEHPRGQEEK